MIYGAFQEAVCYKCSEVLEVMVEPFVFDGVFSPYRYRKLVIPVQHTCSKSLIQIDLHCIARDLRLRSSTYEISLGSIEHIHDTWVAIYQSLSVGRTDLLNVHITYDWVNQF